MRVSVGEGDLRRMLRRFKAVPGTRVEIAMSPEGLEVIANAEGYRTLAKWCLIMAHPEMEQAHPRWLFALRHLDSVRLGAGRVAITWRGGDGQCPLDLRDIHFFRTHSDDYIAEASDGRSRV